MEHVILLLYVKDVVYGKRFLRFLLGKRHPGLHPELVTERDKIEHRVGTDRQSIVVLTDDRTVREDEKRRVIYLSQEKWETRGAIFQFQKVEGIYRQLLEQLDIDPPEATWEQKEEMAGIYVVFAPAGDSGTQFSVMLSQYLGQYGTCLYLNLSGFPVFHDGQFRLTPEYARRGLGELLFFLKDKEFARRQQEIRRPFGNGFMIPPAPHFRDVLDSTPEEWEQLFQQIRGCGYRSIVVEIGQIFDNMLDVMEKGDRVFLVRSASGFDQVREAVFRQYCRLEKREKLERDIEYIQVQDWERELTNQPLEEVSQNPQNMEYIRQLLTGERKEERDVCILEDDG